MSTLLRLGVLLGCATFGVHAWTSYPDTDVVIVSNNDLNSSNPNRQGALYLRASFTCSAAEDACAAYDETLLSVPNGTGFTPANLSAVLTSEKHGAATEKSQKIWISNSKGGCAIFMPDSEYTDTYTETTAESSETYPVLCTNSAPLTRSNVTSDTSRGIEVSTPSAGKLYGYRDKFTFRFLGIKYGEAERFAAPTPYEVDPDTERSAVAYGPVCAQPPDADNGHLTYTNEDCLYLNVYSPVVKTIVAEFSAPKLPVMFFIHGGGLNTGSSGAFPFNMTTDGFVGPSTSNIFDGTNLVSYGGVVLVTIEYRLASFGWFNASNAAVKDAILALEWVQDNIEAFGGDPSKVLIYGESAGGTMTRYLLGVNPKYTDGLFSAAVLESDFETSDPFYSPRLALNTSLALAKLIGCADNSTTEFTNDIALCAQEKPAIDLINASFDYGFSWDITVNGDLVLADIATSIRDGIYSRVPTMFVSNECEYCYFLPTTILPNSSTSAFPDNLGLWFNATQIQKIMNAPADLWPYQTGPSEDGITAPVLQLGRLMTDYYVHCPMAYISSLETNTTNRGNSYKVDFTVGLGSPLTPNPATCVGQVCHADELYYVFATAETDNLYQPLTPAQLATTQDIVSRWTSLAWTGNPNYESAYPEWEPYTGDNEVLIGVPTTIESYRVAQCDWIQENLGLYFGFA
ncbi:Alpha/Beta hydrolase protein [Amylocystis lapponica]|nr:Alpha/Beta hydrolase protein [Amylocystis lapponica]